MASSYQQPFSEISLCESGGVMVASASSVKKRAKIEREKAQA